MSDSAPRSEGHLHEVRYSLRSLLLEVERERESSGLGQEMVDQSEIGKLFKMKKKGKRRAQSGK
jgi:hypothetical protein